MDIRHWLPLHCTHRCYLGIGSGTPKSLPERGSFSQSAFFHSEEQLPCTTGWRNSVRLPPLTSPWKSLAPQPPAQGSRDTLSQASKHLCHFTNALEQRGGIGVGRKGKQKKSLRPEKNPGGANKPGTVVRIDFCLLETVSRKRHSSFMLICPGFCLPPSAKLASSLTLPHWFPV